MLSVIGKSKRASKVLVRTLAAVLPFLGYTVRPDTYKRRVKDAEGNYIRNKDGKCVYRRVGVMDNRFFAIPKFSNKGSALILTARKQTYRSPKDVSGDTYLTKHRGFLTVAVEHSEGRVLWDVQNRDVEVK